MWNGEQGSRYLATYCDSYFATESAAVQAIMPASVPHQVPLCSLKKGEKKIDKEHQPSVACDYTSYNLCPICDTRRDFIHRRRCKSEGVEADPLRESNRLCNMPPPNVGYHKRYSFRQHEIQTMQPDTLHRRAYPVDVDNDICKEQFSLESQQCADEIYDKSQCDHNSLHWVPVDQGLKDKIYSRRGGHVFENSKLHPSSSRHFLNVGRRESVWSHRARENTQNEPMAISEDTGYGCQESSEYFLLNASADVHGGIDGKRMRQRCDSEPSGGCGIQREPKRARDLSPKTSVTSSLYQKFPSVNPNQPAQPLYSDDLKLTGCLSKEDCDCYCSYDDDYDDDNQSADCAVNMSDSEIIPSEHAYEDRSYPESEDDQSVVSSLTTISSDSNTPSVVGETLGTITLNDSVHGNRKDWYTAAPEAPVAPLAEVPFSLRQTENLPNCLRSSLFSYVPPYVNFATYEQKGAEIPNEIRRYMKWRLSTITPMVVRRTISNTGFKLVRKSNEWCGTWGKHMKSCCFRTLKDSQKINHFPGTFQIGRKDRLWKNLCRLTTKFGKKEFGFVPRTFVLPQDQKLLRHVWERNCGKEKWIVKPPASARGVGIKVVHRWSQIPKKRPLIVQKYIDHPYLINGNKFDLRLYVLVTSIDPLRIYIYDDGLVRFASVKYSADMASLSDRYMHLTNYSINKLSKNYTSNSDATACQGHKWTLKSLWCYLKKHGVDVAKIWNGLVDLAIKTVISGESYINQSTKSNLKSRYSAYELFGIDVLLDEKLKPWLLEVNISPSLHSTSALDMAVKGPMVRNLLNMVGFRIPNKLQHSVQEELLKSFGVSDSEESLCFDKRLYTTVLSKEERRKHNLHEANSSREEYLQDILSDLTPDDLRHLILAEDELTQAGRFIKIFPTPNTYTYHEFFEAPRYYNMMFDAWETKYSHNKQEGLELLESLCRQKLHLEVPAGGFSKFSFKQLSTHLKSPSPPLVKTKKEDKFLHDRKSQCISAVTMSRALRSRPAKHSSSPKSSPKVCCIRKYRPSSSPVVINAGTDLSEMQFSDAPNS